jgi:uncharacterized membrane protein
VHVSGGVMALFLGPFQFLRQLRTGKRRAVHRWLGRVYLASVLVSGIAGLFLAPIAYGGLPNRVGFLLMAFVWLTTACAAYMAVRAKDFEAHRRWMMRNYAGTFAAVTLRLWLALFLVCRMDFLLAYQIVAWISWLPNLLVIECWIQWRARQRGQL